MQKSRGERGSIMYGPDFCWREIIAGDDPGCARLIVFPQVGKQYWTGPLGDGRKKSSMSVTLCNSSERERRVLLN